MSALLGDRRPNSDHSYAMLANDELPRWDTEGDHTNVGLWERPGLSIRQACDALVRRCADDACLEKAERILDVGCGMGGPAIVWSGLTKGRFYGINRSPEQTRRAAQRVRDEGLDQRIVLTRADASSLPFADRSFDVVLCVEAAFHFPSREQFFSEAHRVLRPGGRLVTTDVVPSERHPWLARLFWWMFDATMHAPLVNRVSQAEVARQLAVHGFDAEIEERGADTIAPFFGWVGSSFDDPPARWGCRVLAALFRHRAPVDYLFISARKLSPLA